MSLQPAVPVTIIGGYLGAGKTTLINELLAGEHGRRITVVVNDFGAINIDSSLIASRDGNTISLTNGCICCSVAGDLTTELRQLSRAEPVPEQIIVEASGVADPVKVGNTVRGWSSMRLHQTVTLFDPVSVRVLSSDKFVGPTLRRQLRHAHVLLAARLDLLSSDQLTSTLDWLSDLIPDSAARLGPLARNEQIAMLLNLTPTSSVCSSDDATTPIPMQSSVSSSPSVFSSFTWSPAGPVNEGRLRSMLQVLGNRVQRCKGWVELDEPVRSPVLVQHGPAGTQFTRKELMPIAQAALVFVYATGQCTESELVSLLRYCESKPQTG